MQFELGLAKRGAETLERLQAPTRLLCLSTRSHVNAFCRCSEDAEYVPEQNRPDCATYISTFHFSSYAIITAYSYVKFAFISTYFLLTGK